MLDRVLTREEIDAVLDRVRIWSHERQDAAARLLLTLEELDEGELVLPEEELALLDEAIAEADRGEFASEKEVKAFFDRCRL